MRLLSLAAVVLVFPSFAAAQDPAASALKLTLAADKPRVQLGQEIQFEVRLENAGDKDVEINDFQYEERSLTLAVTGTFTSAGDRKRDYVLAVSRPEPQVAGRLPMAKVTLGAKKSLTLLHRVTAVGVGKFEFTAKYGDVASAAVKVDVEGTNQGNRLAAVVEVEEAGAFQIVLTPDVSPVNVTHLAGLISRGFYNDSIVHRIIRHSWIQMGCPYGLGIGGPGYAVKAELDKTVRHEAGTVSMSGYDKSGYTGSQFFIVMGPHPSLDGKYTTIGKVEGDGLSKVVEPLSKKDTDRNTDMPRQPVKIKKVTLAVIQ
jgi:peptidyl-prolyl cis-trans isomerase B (cyclophilin B)